MKTGSWFVKIECTLEGQDVDFDNLSEVTQKHICNEILGGYRYGEICEVDDEDDND